MKLNWRDLLAGKRKNNLVEWWLREINDDTDKYLFSK
jgi:hypothetical protein